MVIFIPFQGSVDRFRRVDRSNLWSLQGKSVSYPDPVTIPESLLHIPMRRERETLSHIQPTDCYYEIRSLVDKRNMDDHSDHFSYIESDKSETKLVTIQARYTFR